MDGVANAVVGIKRVQTAFERRAGLKNASRRQVAPVFFGRQIGSAYFAFIHIYMFMHIQKIANRG